MWKICLNLTFAMATWAMENLTPKESDNPGIIFHQEGGIITYDHMINIVTKFTIPQKEDMVYDLDLSRFDEFEKNATYRDSIRLYYVRLVQTKITSNMLLPVIDHNSELSAKKINKYTNMKNYSDLERKANNVVMLKNEWNDELWEIITDINDATEEDEDDDDNDTPVVIEKAREPIVISDEEEEASSTRSESTSDSSKNAPGSNQNTSASNTASDEDDDASGSEGDGTTADEKAIQVEMTTTNQGTIKQQSSKRKASRKPAQKEKTPFLQKQEVAAANVDIFAFINAKALFLEKHLKKQMKEMYETLVLQRCKLERKVIENALAIATLQPSELAYQILGKRGVMAVPAGECVHFVTCLRVNLEIRDTNDCYNEIPVQHGNESLFLAPRSRILIAHGKNLLVTRECRLCFKIGQIWYRMLPDLIDAPTPTIIEPQSQTDWKYANTDALATGGVYDFETSARVRLVRPTIKPPHGPDTERIDSILKELNLDSLNSEERAHIINLVAKFPQQFHLPSDRLSMTRATTHKIVTTDDIPINVKQYRHPPYLRDEIQKQITELITNDIVEESDSPYNSPLWIVPKKAGPNGEKKWRLVIDYRMLNEKTIASAYPLPNITEIPDQPGSSKYFSTLDLQSGFYQVPIEPCVAHKTAFSTPFHHLQFKRMPMGLKGSPSTFQALMDKVLTGLQGIELFIYMDDIVVYASSLEEHKEKISKLFGRLKTAGLTVRPDKCFFLRKKVGYLGHIISKDGVRPDPPKVIAVRDFHRPKSKKNIKQFLGLAGYYRRFIPNFAKTASPLHAVNANADALSRNPVPVSPPTPVSQCIDDYEHEIERRIFAINCLEYANDRPEVSNSRIGHRGLAVDGLEISHQGRFAKPGGYICHQGEAADGQDSHRGELNPGDCHRGAKDRLVRISHWAVSSDGLEYHLGNFSHSDGLVSHRAEPLHANGQEGHLEEFSYLDGLVSHLAIPSDGPDYRDRNINNVEVSSEGGDTDDDMITGISLLPTGQVYPLYGLQAPNQGSLERSHHSLIEYLKMYINDSHWDTWIRYAVFSYNTSIHTAHGFTPHELIFARKARIPSEFANTTISKTYNDILDDIARKLNITQREAHDKIIEAKKKSKAYYDLKSNSKRKNYHTEPCLLQLRRAHPPLNYSATRRYSRDDPKKLPNTERKRHLRAIFLRETHGTSVRAKIPPSAHVKKKKRDKKMISDIKYLVIKNEVVFSNDDENHEEGADAPGEIDHAAEVGEARAISNDQVEAGGMMVREHEEIIEAAAAQEPVNQTAAQQEIAPQLRHAFYVQAIPLPAGQPRGATATWSLYNAVGEDMELLRRFREGRIRVTNERMRGTVHAQAVLITSPHAETVGLLCCGERVTATWRTGYRITHHHLVGYEADVRRMIIERCQGCQADLWKINAPIKCIWCGPICIFEHYKMLQGLVFEAGQSLAAEFLQVDVANLVALEFKKASSSQPRDHDVPLDEIEGNLSYDYEFFNDDAINLPDACMNDFSKKMIMMSYFQRRMSKLYASSSLRGPIKLNQSHLIRAVHLFHSKHYIYRNETSNRILSCCKQGKNWYCCYAPGRRLVARADAQARRRRRWSRYSSDDPDRPWRSPSHSSPSHSLRLVQFLRLKKNSEKSYRMALHMIDIVDVLFEYLGRSDLITAQSVCTISSCI
ncbi:unnamed protein product [Trichogramma brassicae]|uniref:Reverse transcriptase domain-containing protein n=1 Tax=Trichogramma brassicae TaxID=86971 RepID=A0A6H5IM76_9HYME|nr:unnamed protein product [Trichogramma brassicae]